jgi:hypothetical protein
MYMLTIDLTSDLLPYYAFASPLKLGNSVNIAVLEMQHCRVTDEFLAD